MYRMVAVVMISLIALACAGNSFADDLEWFLAPEGMKKEFEIRNPSGNNPVVGKTTQIVSEIEDDQFGDKTVKIVFKSSFGQMSTNGYKLYKLDKGTNRILQIEMYNQQTGLRQTWDDPYSYVIMSLPLTVGKSWNYQIPPETDKIRERKVISKEKIKLPAGDFEVIIIKDEQMGDMEYYAKGVGLVATKKNNGNNWYWMYKLKKVSK